MSCRIMGKERSDIGENLYDYISDAAGDYKELDVTKLAPGSTVLDASSGTVRILSPSKEWKTL